MFPNEGIPDYPEDLTHLGILVIHDSTPPAPGLMKKIVRGAPVKNTEDKWVWSWDIVNMTPEEQNVKSKEFYDLVEAALNKTFKDIDGVYESAIGNRVTEYTEAEAVAREYVNAGYTGPVSPYISGYASNNPTNIVQTNKWAADEIIARADAFSNAQLSMRTTRFAKQAEMRAATTKQGLDAVVNSWNQYIATLRGQLGLK